MNRKSDPKNSTPNPYAPGVIVIPNVNETATSVSAQGLDAVEAEVLKGNRRLLGTVADRLLREKK